MDVRQSIDSALDTAVSLAKLALHSRRHTVTPAGADEIIIMGNGPSLRQTIDEYAPLLRQSHTLAVNFAANTPEFADLKPCRYLLADPHFFSLGHDSNVDLLWQNLAQAHPMTLYVPCRRVAQARKFLGPNSKVTVEGFNDVGVEGANILRRMAYKHGWGMPRPRNVLIPAIMVAMLAGYRRIRIVGADHSWMRTLAVDDQNHVISVQPHFYADSTTEKQRVSREYTNYRLHDIVRSFYVAFKSYHHIAAYARHQGIEITNATPDSFIDAFPRQPLHQR